MGANAFSLTDTIPTILSFDTAICRQVSVNVVVIIDDEVLKLQYPPEKQNIP